MPNTAVIAGLGPGFCERFAERLARDGFSVGLLGRSEDYLAEFAQGLRDDGHDALAVPTDITESDQVSTAFETLQSELGPVEVLANTASTVTDDDRAGIHPDRFEKMWRLYAYGSLLCFRAAFDDLQTTDGTVLFFGALDEQGDTAFKSGKDAARGLARSLADEYGPDGIHVAHVIIGGIMLNPDVREAVDDPDPAEYLDPAAVADACMDVIAQPGRAQTFDLDLRTESRGLY